MTQDAAIPPSPPIPRTHPLAIWSLVLSLAGLFCCFLASIPGIILGHVARGRIARSGGAYEGGGLALVGILVGWGGIILNIVGMALLTFFMLHPAAIRSWLEHLAH